MVDEEQRFGVAHKEMIKKIKINIDVLSVTATPIPRTMIMTIFGDMDTSIIKTKTRGMYVSLCFPFSSLPCWSLVGRCT